MTIDNITSGLTPDAVDDLALSGLVATDIAARRVSAAEFAATGSQITSVPDGYMIPYFDIHGELIPFYRIKILALRSKAKYMSMKDRPNHIYFPPGLPVLLHKHSHNYIIITEGEKKAACAVKQGFPCVALAGVDSWRNRQITLPENTEFKVLKRHGIIQAKIPSGDSNSMVTHDTGVVAIGFSELIDYLVMNKMEAIIIFDSDKDGIKIQVQRAAAQLGYELRYRGLSISSIRQLVLPKFKDTMKVGLDDYLIRRGNAAFAARLRICRAKRIAFPQHPNPKTFIASKMQKGRLSRKETQDVSLSILMELEARGRRLRNISTQVMFWFNEQTHNLMDVHLASNRILLHDTAFGAYLYREFNVSATDTRVIGWLAAQFNGEPGAEETITHRVLALPGDLQGCIAYQLSDSHFIVMTADPKEPYIICENGTHGVLFEQGHVKPIAYATIEMELSHWMDHPQMLWQDVLSEFNFRPSMPTHSVAPSVRSEERLLREGRQLAELLYYLSPWFLKWRGLQLPVELTIGEPGSGKSSLYELRQTIISGIPRLSNMTMDIKDWYAGITSTGGLHVLDNVHFTGGTKDYQQRLSDELAQPLYARILTPHGWSTIGDVHVGDAVLDPWGNPVQIIKEHLLGHRQVFRVHLSDGTYVECCKDHLWFVQTRDYIMFPPPQRGHIKSLEQIMETPLRYAGETRRAKWYVPGLQSNSINLTHTDPDRVVSPLLTPYVLGAFLGDGNLSSRQLFLAGIDTDIIERVKQELPKGLGLGSSKLGHYYVRGDGEVNTKILKDVFIDLDLLGCLAETKFIPEEYLFTTAGNRLDLLRGLMDTDGTVNNSGTGYYSTISGMLAIGVNFLAGSLGGKSTINRRKDGAYQVSVILPEGISPFHCIRKDLLYMSRKHMSNRRSIVHIERMGYKEEVKCITLGSEEGLYVTDNFTVTHNCRLVTEPNPHVEMRKLYTNADIISLPVTTTFALTSIEQPFFTIDLIQRSAIFELQVIQQGHDANWVKHQIERAGGRAGWVAHQLVVIHKFLVLAKDKWDDNYRAGHRLAHYEQALILMAEVVGIPNDWIPAALKRQTAAKMTETDWAMSGLEEFVVQFKAIYGDKYARERFGVKDIVEWADQHITYSKNGTLTNGWRLAKYFRSHKGLMQKTVGIYESGTRNNSIMYSVQ